MSYEIIIFIVLSIIIVALLATIGYFWYFFYYKHKYKEFKKTIVASEQIKQQKIALDKQSALYDQKIKALGEKFNELPNFSATALKQEYFNWLELTSQALINERLNEVRETSVQQASQIIVDAMEGLSDELINDNCLTVVPINEESVKGRVIGRNGRNKKVFEALTKTDLIIDQDEKSIAVSSHNPVRKEIAAILLTQLIKSKVIEPVRIEVLYEEIKKEFNDNLFSIGKQTVEQDLLILDLPHELYPFIGRLKYRSSYGQNTLKHVIECAKIANHMALALNLDVTLATKCALLHDIGKSNDYEVNQSHVDAGLAIIKNMNLPGEIANSIESHHGQTAASSIYAQIAIMADTISAGRPGARINSSNEFFERIQTIENAVLSFPEVTAAYALRSGRQLRVFVNPTKIQDDEMEWFAEKIKTKLKSENSMANYNIKVIIIKEKKYEFNTGDKL